MQMPFSHPATHSTPRSFYASFAISIVVAAAAVAGLMLSSAPEGSVQGECILAETSRPLAKVNVSLALHTTDNTASNRYSVQSNNPEDDASRKSAPDGWSAGFGSDATSPGWDLNPNSTSLSVRTDKRGHFALSHLPAGVYDVLASSDGSSLGQGITVTVEEGRVAHLTLHMHRDPSRLSFEGTFLKWKPGDSLSYGFNGLLQSRRVSAILDRVDLDSLVSRHPAGLLNPAADPGSLAAAGVHISTIRRWSEPITRASREGSFNQHLALGRLPLGMYRITIENRAEKANSDPGLPSDVTWPRATAWALVTRMGLVSKASRGGVLAYVVDSQSGRPLPRVPVTLHSSGQPSSTVISAAKTSPQGLARLATAGSPMESQGVLIARDGDAAAATSIELNSPGSDGVSFNNDDSPGAPADSSAAAALSAGASLRTYIYTDRPIYRPGDTVSLKGICRWYVPRTGYRVASGAPVVLEVRDAQETLIVRRALKTNAMGSWNSSLSLDAEALTGEYQVTATVAGDETQSSFAVAAYHKPEFSVTVTPSKDRIIRGQPLKAAISANYFFGAPLAGGVCTVTILKSGDFAAEGTDSGMSSDAAGDVGGEPVLDESIRLDDRGQAQVTWPTKPGTDNEGDVWYTISARVEDTGQESQSGSTQIMVAQGEFSINTRVAPAVCRPGQTVRLYIDAHKESGVPLAGQPLTIRAAYESWESEKARVQVISTSALTTDATGSAETGVLAPRGGLLRIRASGVDRRGNTVTSTSEVWVAADTSSADETRYPDLALVLDRDHYHIGDTAHLLINPVNPGPTALITLEGQSLHRAWTIPLLHRSTSADVRISEALSPGVTLSVCCIHGGQFYSASTALSIDDTRRTLHIAVWGDRNRYHPGDPALVHVRTTNAAGSPVPAEVSVAVVDSAIYAIRPDDTDGLKNAFLPSQPNQVTTSNSCERIYYGDVDKGDTSIKIRSHFQDTAFWNPTLQTDSSGSASVRFQLPDNLTTWRVTCVGHTASTEIGTATCNLVSNKDLLVRLEAPAFLVEGDHAEISALIHNNTTSPLHGTLRLTAAGLKVQGSFTQTVDVSPASPLRLTWPVQAQPHTLLQPDSRVRVTVRAGSLSDGVEATIPVDPHGVRRDTWQAGSITHFIEKTVTPDATAISNSTELVARLAPTISSALLPALDYLGAYPYGSTNATVDILTGNLALARAAGVPSGPKALPLSESRRTQQGQMVRRSLLRLYRFQREDGGWSWWDIGDSDLLMSADALRALEMAAAAGFPVNPKVQQSATVAVRRLAKDYLNQDKGNGSHDKSEPNPAPIALAALALAHAGETVGADENLSYLESQYGAFGTRLTRLGFAAQAQAALAELALGRQAEAHALLENILSARQRLGALAAWPASPHEDYRGREQDAADSRATSWVFLAIQTIEPDAPAADAVARWLMANRTGDYWFDTGATATTLLGLSAYMARSHELQPNFTARLLVNGRLIRSIHFGAESILQPDIVVRIAGSSLSAGRNTVRLEKSGPGRLYYSLDLRQVLHEKAVPPAPSLWKRLLQRITHPVPAPLPPTPSGYRIKRVYMRMTTRRSFLWEDTVPCRETTFRRDETILVRLIINNIRPGSHVLVEEPIPAGCRITDTSADERENWSDWWSYTDVRDDRIVFFIDDLPRGEHEITYHLQAQTPGRYDSMPSVLTGMFDPTLHATGAANHINIVEGDS